MLPFPLIPVPELLRILVRRELRWEWRLRWWRRLRRLVRCELPPPDDVPPDDIPAELVDPPPLLRAIVAPAGSSSPSDTSPAKPRFPHRVIS